VVSFAAIHNFTPILEATSDPEKRLPLRSPHVSPTAAVWFRITIALGIVAIVVVVVTRARIPHVFEFEVQGRRMLIVVGSRRMDLLLSQQLWLVPQERLRLLHGHFLAQRAGLLQNEKRRSHRHLERIRSSRNQLKMKRTKILSIGRPVSRSDLCQLDRWEPEDRRDKLLEVLFPPFSFLAVTRSAGGKRRKKEYFQLFS
jgi:hypothetical protein